MYELTFKNRADATVTVKIGCTEANDITISGVLKDGGSYSYLVKTIPPVYGGYMAKVQLPSNFVYLDNAVLLFEGGVETVRVSRSQLVSSGYMVFIPAGTTRITLSAAKSQTNLPTAAIISGEAVLAPDPVILTEEQSVDLFEPVRCWSGYINFARTSPEAVMMLTSQEWPVEILVGTQTVFYGGVRCEAFTTGLTEYPMSFALPIECAISKLKGKDFPKTIRTVNVDDLISECIAQAIPNATKTVAATSLGSVNTATFLGKWDAFIQAWEREPTYYDVLRACLQPRGYVLHSYGKHVFVVEHKATGSAQSMTSGKIWADVSSTISIERPKKSVKVKGAAPIAEEPRLELEAFGTKSNQSSDVVADKIWSVNSAGSNGDSEWAASYQSSGGTHRNQLIELKKNDTFVGGASWLRLYYREDDNLSVRVKDSEGLLLTRGWANKGGDNFSHMMAKLKMKTPWLSQYALKITGTVKGMTESGLNRYEWDSNCAGWLVTKIRLAGYYLNRDGNWQTTDTQVRIPLGENGKQKAADSGVSYIGANADEGFSIAFPWTNKPEVNDIKDMMLEVEIYGFNPMDDDTVFAIVENLTICEAGERNQQYNVEKRKCSDAGREEVNYDLPLVGSVWAIGSYYGMSLDLAAAGHLLQKAKNHYSKSVTQLKVNWRGAYSMAPTTNYAYNGKELAPLAVQLHLRDMTQNVTLVEI